LTTGTGIGYFLKKKSRLDKFLEKMVNSSCLKLSFEDPGSCYCGQAHSVPHNQHDVPHIQVLYFIVQTTILRDVPNRKYRLCDIMTCDAKFECF
jgi:hypothetical protein